MGYAKMLKKLFPNVKLGVEDLFFLESFQVKYLPDRVLKPEFAVLLRNYPIIHRYFVAMCPSVSKAFDSILNDNLSIENNKTVDENCNDLLWEIADLIVYSKYPEIYAANIEFVWDIDEIISPDILKGKVAIDAGAGPGKLAFMLAQFAKTVFAVEPVKGFRQYIKEKASRENVKNVHTMDGCLDSIPLPDNSIDVLMTSQAIGWNLEGELREIERVLKPNSSAIHLFHNPVDDKEATKSIHDFITSSKWEYECIKYQDSTGWKIKYYKTIVS